MSDNTKRVLQLHWALEAYPEQPPTKWLVKNLLVEDGVSVWFGDPGVKKTYSLLDLSVCVALGNPWLGFDTTQCPVLIIDEENGDRRLKRRLHNVMIGHDAGPDIPIAFTTMQGFCPSRACDFEALQVAIKEAGAKLIIIDSLVDVLAKGANENSANELHDSLSPLAMIAKTLHVHIALIDHANRQGAFRGSGDKKGFCELMVIMTSPKGSTRITFDIDKARDIDDSLKFSASIHFAGPGSEGTYLSPSATEPKAIHFSRSEICIMRILDNGDCKLTDISNRPDVKDFFTPSTIRNAACDLKGRGYVERKNSSDDRKAIYGLTPLGKRNVPPVGV
jgi:hypothetical protein